MADQSDKTKLRLDMPMVETERLILRNITLADARDMFEYAGDEETTCWLQFPTHQSVEDSAKAITDFFIPRVKVGVPSGYCVVLKENNKMIGTCDIAAMERFDSVEIGYVINKHYTGKGYCTEACLKLIEMCFEYVGLRRLSIQHDADNIASQRVIEKCGFVYEGTRRQYLPRKSGGYGDSRIYSLLKEDYLKGKKP